MIDVKSLWGLCFPGCLCWSSRTSRTRARRSCVRARTRGEAVACPGCGAETARVHGYHERTAADVPVDGRRVVVKVRVRRMRCPALGCTVQTFREQVPGVLDRYQRRIARLTAQVSAVARELAGRASARLLPALGIGVSRHTALRALLRSPFPRWRCRGCWGSTTSRCAAAASTRPCSSTPRPAGASTSWKAAPPTSRRNGCAATPASRSLPRRVRGLRRGRPPGAARRGPGQRPLAPVALLAEAVRKEVAAHSACWAKGIPLQEGKRAETTAERWQQVHDLRAQERRPARLLPPPGPVPEHGQALRPGQRARAAAARPAVPAHPRRPLPRLPAQAARRGARRPGPAAAPRDPRARLPGQLQPPRPLHQPGPRWTATARTCRPAGPPASC